MKENAKAEFRRTAYEAHYRLLEHYSSLIFRARVAILTVTMLVLAYVFGVSPSLSADADNVGVLNTRGIIGYLAAVFIDLLYLMETSYLKRFYQVIASGRQYETDGDSCSYFSRYDKPESWPIHIAYLLAVLVLTGMFIGIVWHGDRSVVHSIILSIIGVVPIVLCLWARRRSQSVVGRALTDSGC